MITTITNRGPGYRRNRRAAFTLAESLIAIAVSSIIMAAVLTSFYQMIKSGLNVYNYVDMEEEARRGLEQFGEDVRMAYQSNLASPVTVNGAQKYQDVTLYMTGTTADATKDVRYYYDSGTKTFRRSGPDRATGAISDKALIHHVENDFNYSRWYRGVPPTNAGSDARTWQLQLSLTILKQVNEFGISTPSNVAATNLVVSARYILRNRS
jgi:prepilin-type N-terminal cleavage/methylation domain-containing protein